jgi:hypothetical protein
MTMQRRQHRSEFKAKVALEAIHGEWTLNELAAVMDWFRRFVLS